MKKVTLYKYIILILCCSLLWCSCDLEYPEETEVTNATPASTENVIILNGHINEQKDEVITTPCCLTYGLVGLVVETEITDDLSDYLIEEEINSSDSRLLVVHVQVVNTLRSLDKTEGDFSVKADGVECREIQSSYENNPQCLPKDRQTDLFYFYEVPAVYSSLDLVHERFVYPETITFQVQEDGEFNDDDLSYIYSLYDVSESDENNEYSVQIDEATSDSYYHSNTNGTDYSIANTYDGNLTTCWQDGSDGDAIGEQLKYYFEATEIYGIRIVNGNRTRNNSYINNNRLESVLLSFRSGDIEICEVVMEFPDDNQLENTFLSLDRPMNCDSVILTIQSVYKGSTYDDTGITEIEFVSHRYNSIGLIAYNRIEELREQRRSTITPVTSHDDYDYGSPENPRVITYDNYSSLRPNTYVSITGPVSCLSSSTGQFTIGGDDTPCGLWIHIENSDGSRYYLVEVPSVSANGFEAEFASHCPADVNPYPRTIGDRRYCGCTATIVGRYESYSAYVDGSYIDFYRLSSDSKIVDLNFYY